MAYESSVWFGAIASLCPSLDTSNDGTTTVKDFARISNGVFTNAAVIANNWVTDGGARALYFDGVNDHVVTEFIAGHALKELTLSYWFRRTGVGVRGPGVSLANALGVSTSFAVYPYEDGKLYVQLSSSQFASVTLNDSNWHHICVCFDGDGAANADRLKVFVDGVQATLAFTGTMPVALSTATSLAPSRLWLGVGIATSNYYGAGFIDDVRVMCRSVTLAERQELEASRGGTFAETSSGTSGFTGLSGVGRLGT